MPEIHGTPGVYIQEVSATQKTIGGASTSTTILLGTFPAGPLFSPIRVRTILECEQTFGGLKTDNFSSRLAQQFFDNGGSDLWVMATGRRQARTATSLLKCLSMAATIDSFNILLIPSTAFLPDREATRVFQAAVPLVERARAIYLPDPPQRDAMRQTAKDLLAWSSRQLPLQHPNVVMYHPRIQVSSPISTTPLTLPSSGTIAGLYTRVDHTHGVWKSPAGTEATLQGVLKLETVLTESDLNLLTAANINPLKLFPSSGVVAWGARTRSMDSEWKYVPVRRTALFLEASIDKGLEWAVFEPNDEPLWAQIRQTVGAFLHSLFRQGVFQGAKPEQAYFVKCGRETTTTADQTAGIVNLVVGFAPLKPAEFIILKFQQKTRRMP